MTDFSHEDEPNDSAITVKLPKRLHDAVCRKALLEHGGNVSGMIRAILAVAVATKAPSR
jgi:hypothetical protein